MGGCVNQKSDSRQQKFNLQKIQRSKEPKENLKMTENQYLHRTKEPVVQYPLNSKNQYLPGKDRQQEQQEANPYLQRQAYDPTQSSRSKAEKLKQEMQRQKDQRDRIALQRKQAEDSLRKKQQQARKKAVAQLKQPQEHKFSAFKLFLKFTKNSMNHIDIKCSKCFIRNFTGIRLHCLECQQDYCSVCFQHQFQHDCQHPFLIINNQLNSQGSDRLKQIIKFYKSRSEQQPNITYQSTCQACQSQKESMWLTGVFSGRVLCKQCFKEQRNQQFFVVQFIPITWNIDLSQFIIQGKKMGFKEQNSLAVHKLSKRQFLLKKMTITIEDEAKYYKTRNALLKFRGNHVQNIYAYNQHEYAQRMAQLTILQEWMPNLTLKDLLASKTYQALSWRRKLGIIRSLASALKSIHGLGLYHGNLSPEIILLDMYHQVHIQLVPYVNHQAKIEDQPYLMNPFRQEIQDQKSDIYSLGLLSSLVLSGVEHQHKAGGKVTLPTLAILSQLVAQCVGKRETRPKASQIDKRLSDLQNNFWILIDKEVGRQRYQHLSKPEKDKMFINFMIKR